MRLHYLVKLKIRVSCKF